MTQDDMKKQAAEAALKYISEDAIIGIGSGSTVKFFIEALASIKNRVEGTIASSLETERLLKQHGIPVYDLNTVNGVSLYVDGADEANDYFYLIKGKGGALTREKIIATVSKKFICIIDQSKKVDVLGTSCPVPVEVLPMARSYVARELVKLGGSPVYREGFVTDNGNIILDVHHLKIFEPLTLEQHIKTIPGVIENGLFARRPADVILMATPTGIQTQRSDLKKTF